MALPPVVGTVYTWWCAPLAAEASPLAEAHR